MKIKYGSIEYFTLLSFRDKLKGTDWDKLDLEYLDKLRAEVERRVRVIYEERVMLLRNDIIEDTY